MARAQDLISTAYQRIVAEIPAFDKLKLVIRLELRGRGDVQVFRVRIPGPEVTKVDPDDARIDVSMPRSHFNELATEGLISDWHRAYQEGHVKATGNADVLKLLGTVVERHEARAKLRRAR
jgi:hypothetical protein